MVPEHNKGITGFTLLEIMIAVTFFAVAFLSLMDAYNKGVFADIYLDRAAIAVNLAQERMEQYRSGAYAGVIPTGTVTENPVTGFATPAFRRVTTIALTAANPNSTYKTVTVTVSWQMKGTWQDYALISYFDTYMDR
jgi:type II secretory pathway pseudopilin PulG